MASDTSFMRFLDKVLLDDGCWIWTGCKTKAGYGYLGYLGRSIGAHVFSWMYFRGQTKVPNGFEVCHSCHNPSCVRPNHLFLGTHAQNLSVRSRKFTHMPRKIEES